MQARATSKKTLEQLVLTTSNGSRTFSSADLDAENVPGRAFSVFGSGTDRDAPVVTAVINHGWASGRFWIRYDLVDYVTGVRSSSARLWRRERRDVFTAPRRP